MTDIQQRPEPRFKVGQVVMVANSDRQPPMKISAITWMNGWFYGWGFGNIVYEVTLRPLSIDEIGSDELTGMAERLTEAEGREADSDRRREEWQAKFVAERAITVRMLKALNTFVDHFGDSFQEAHAVIAEAEAAIQGGE